MARPMEDLRAACDGHTQRIGRRRRKAQREGALRLAKGLKQLLAPRGRLSSVSSCTMPLRAWMRGEAWSTVSSTCDGGAGAALCDTSIEAGRERDGVGVAGPAEISGGGGVDGHAAGSVVKLLNDALLLIIDMRLGAAIKSSPEEQMSCLARFNLLQLIHAKAIGREHPCDLDAELFRACAQEIGPAVVRKTPPESHPSSPFLRMLTRARAEVIANVHARA